MQAGQREETSARPTLDQLQALKRLGAATIHEAQGQVGALDSGIKPLDPRLKLAGPALTVDCLPQDNLAIHLALTRAEPGDVLVVDAKGFLEGGPWGDLLTLAAQKRGLAGLVIDGAVRDGDAIIELGFPVFARGLSIKATHKNHAGRIAGPIVCGGQPISHGDVIVGDRDGLVVIRGGLDEVIAASEAREAKECWIRERIEAGESTVEILRLGPTLERLGAHPPTG